jgi:hypothetical protein
MEFSTARLTEWPADGYGIRALFLFDRAILAAPDCSITKHSADPVFLRLEYRNRSR